MAIFTVNLFQILQKPFPQRAWTGTLKRDMCSAGGKVPREVIPVPSPQIQWQHLTSWKSNLSLVTAAGIQKAALWRQPGSNPPLHTHKVCCFPSLEMLAWAPRVALCRPKPQQPSITGHCWAPCIPMRNWQSRMNCVTAACKAEAWFKNTACCRFPRPYIVHTSQGSRKELQRHTETQRRKKAMRDDCQCATKPG